MKLRNRSDDARALQKHSWSQMGDWLAELRDDSRAEPPGDGHAEADPAGDPWPEALAQADALAEARARDEARARAQAAARTRADARAQARARAQADARAQARARAQADARAAADERPVIGDQLRMPVMWCELGSCISWYTHPAALGEADTRARAIAAGWRIDALGRLACPQCQQTDPGFWATCPVVPKDRYTAIAGTVGAAVPGGRTAGSAGGTSRDPGRAASGYPPVGRAERECHHDLPADEAVPAGRYAADPAGTSRSRLAALNAVEPGEPAAARQRHRQASEQNEDVMIAERAHANPAGATTSTEQLW